MLSIPELQGYLSSLITDENVPEADRLKTADKVNVAKYLIELNRSSSEYMKDPSKLMGQTIETKIKTLSVESIKKLIDASDDVTKKNEIINKINVKGLLTTDDISLLYTLSIEELLNILTKIEGGEDGKPKDG
jgi:hypothetical protein